MAGHDLKRRKSRFESAAPIVVFSIVLIAWEFVSRAGIVNSLLLPAPTQIVRAGILGLFDADDISYNVAAHAGHSLMLLAIGFPVGVIAAILGGMALGLSTPLYRALNPILGFILPIPAIAWAPIAMIWFGLGTPAVLAVVIVSCFSEMIFNVVAGVRSVPRNYAWQVQTFGASRWFVFWRVILPAAFPQIFTGIKLGLAASWRSLIGAEMFAGVTLGLGLMLFEAHDFYATDVMFVALAIVAIVSLAIEQIGLRAIERRTLERWGLTNMVET